MSCNYSGRYRVILAVFLFVALLAPLEAQRTKSSQQAGEQRKAEKGLKDNARFISFLNSSISNTGTEEEKKKFREAVQRDMLSQILYMKFLFHDSFMEIRHAQELLIDSYRSVIDRESKSIRALLNEFAPEVIHSDDHLAREYLRLGYRDLEESKIKALMADSYRNSLYSMRLYEYIRAIKKLKHGRRYAFLALLEARRGVRESMKPLPTEYEQLRPLVASLSEEKKESYLLLHEDSYYRIISRDDFRVVVWDNPSLDELPEYSHYLEEK